MIDIFLALKGENFKLSHYTVFLVFLVKHLHSVLQIHETLTLVFYCIKGSATIGLMHGVSITWLWVAEFSNHTDPRIHAKFNWRIPLDPTNPEIYCSTTQIKKKLKLAHTRLPVRYCVLFCFRQIKIPPLFLSMYVCAGKYFLC